METTNMDYRLDLFNAVEKYCESMSEEDAIFVIAHNTKNNDLFASLMVIGKLYQVFYQIIKDILI